MGLYSAIAAAYGALCYTFIRFFAFLLLWVTRIVLQLGLWGENKLTTIWPMPKFMKLLGSSGSQATNPTESVAAFLVYLFLLVVVGLVVAFIISFYFSAKTIIYSLMRHNVDNTPLEDIYTYFDEPETETAQVES